MLSIFTAPSMFHIYYLLIQGFLDLQLSILTIILHQLSV